MNEVINQRELAYYDSTKFIEVNRKAQVVQRITMPIMLFILPLVLWYINSQAMGDINWITVSQAKSLESSSNIFYLVFGIVCWVIATCFLMKISKINENFRSLGQEQLHITENGIWGYSILDGNIKVNFSEIASVRKITLDKVTFGDNKCVNKDVLTLQITTSTGKVIRYAYLGSENIELSNQIFISKIQI